MRRNRSLTLSTLAAGIVLVCFGTAGSSSVQAQVIAPPEGWIKTDSNGATIFRPEDAPPGKMCFIMIFPDEPLGGKTLPQWLNQRIDTILAKSGTLIRRGKVEQKTPKVLVCASAFKPASDEKLVGVFTAVAPRPGYGRLLMLTTDADSNFRERYKKAAAAIIRDFMTAPHSDSKENSDGHPSGTAPTPPKEKPVNTAGDKEVPAKAKDDPSGSGG